MHFSSIIITNTGWLLDKPRERARAKTQFETCEIDYYISLSRVGASCRVSSVSPLCTCTRDDVDPNASARTHINASTHNTVIRSEFGQTRSRPCARARTIVENASNFCICIPGVVRNVFSRYNRNYTYV